MQKIKQDHLFLSPEETSPDNTMFQQNMVAYQSGNCYIEFLQRKKKGEVEISSLIVDQKRWISLTDEIRNFPSTKHIQHRGNEAFVDQFEG